MHYLESMNHPLYCNASGTNDDGDDYQSPGNPTLDINANTPGLYPQHPNHHLNQHLPAPQQQQQQQLLQQIEQPHQSQRQPLLEYYEQQQLSPPREEKKFSQAVDNLLLQEIMQLSLQDRNDIQEEIHGVKCLASTETQLLLVSSLRRLETELDKVVPSEKNKPFLLARELGEDSYVNTVEFKLRFLRRFFFDAKEAAVCICSFLHQISSIFGSVSLKRQLSLHKDFKKRELREFRKGRFQLLPFRDRSGRRILVIFADEELEQMAPGIRAKFIFYLSTVATRDDVETQRKGLVVIIWFSASYSDCYRSRIRQSPLQDYGSWICVRVSALHVCSPNTPAFRFRRAIFALRAYRHRSRLKIHAGEPVELRYILQGFGIPTENIPLTWSGSIKVVYLKNWMKLRNAIEDDEYEQCQLPSGGLSLTSSNSIMSNVVECPNSNDVIFRQGTSLNCHTGNVRFRSLVESTVIRFRSNPSSSNISTNDQDDSDSKSFNEDGDEKSSSSTPTSTLISEIIDRIITKDEGRVLVWTPNHGKEKYGCWCKITNEDQIYSKIEYIVREHIRGGSTSSSSSSTTQAATLSKTEKQRSNLQINESSTSIFRSEILDDCISILPEPKPSIAAANLADSSPNKRAKTSSKSSDLPAGEDNAKDNANGNNAKDNANAKDKANDKDNDSMSRIMSSA